MSTSAISSGNSSLQALLLQSRQDMQTLQTDLGSGNLPGAQTDFAAFQKDAMGLFQGANGQQANPNMPQTMPAQTAADLQSIQAALSSGDVSGAQKALTTFEQDLRNQMQNRTHMHHFHHHQETNSAQDANGGASSLTGNAAAANGPAAALNPMTLKSLFSAYQGFNLSSAASSAGLSLIG